MLIYLHLLPSQPPWRVSRCRWLTFWVGKFSRWTGTEFWPGLGVTSSAYALTRFIQFIITGCIICRINYVVNTVYFQTPERGHAFPSCQHLTDCVCFQSSNGEPSTETDRRINQSPRSTYRRIRKWRSPPQRGPRALPAWREPPAQFGGNLPQSWLPPTCRWSGFTLPMLHDSTPRLVRHRGHSKTRKSLEIVSAVLPCRSSMNGRCSCDVIGPARGHFLVPSAGFLFRGGRSECAEVAPQSLSWRLKIGTAANYTEAITGKLLSKLVSLLFRCDLAMGPW